MPTHRVVKIDELSQYFHLPEKAVARQLGVCLTSLKKICRQNGISRWPYRKLKSLDKKINKIENALTNSAEDPSAMLIKWEMLKLEKKNLPFSNHADDSDVETRKRTSPVANAGVVSCSSANSPASSVVDDGSSSTTSPSTAASGAVTPNHHPHQPSFKIHAVLEQRLKQVKQQQPNVVVYQQQQPTTPTTTSNNIINNNNSSAHQQPPKAPRPEQLEFVDDVVSPVMANNEFDPCDEEASRLADYYCRTDSARYYNSNNTATMMHCGLITGASSNGFPYASSTSILDEPFRVPMISPTSDVNDTLFSFYNEPLSGKNSSAEFFCNDDTENFFMLPTA